MNRRILLLNLVLAALVGLLAWQFRERRQTVLAKENSVLLKGAHPQAILAPPPPAPVPAVAAAEYNDTVQKMLFSKDRNPNVVVVVPPPPPPPPPPPSVPALPVYFGQIGFGGPPEVILSPAGGGAQKGYAAGENMGDFKVVSFDRDNITFEWKGQVVQRKLADLKQRDAGVAPQGQQVYFSASGTTPPGLPPAAAPPPATQSRTIAIGNSDTSSAASTVPSVVGTPSGGGFYNCKADDKTPSGTVVGGYRKTSAQGLMGLTCRWEQVQ